MIKLIEKYHVLHIYYVLHTYSDIIEQLLGKGKIVIEEDNVCYVVLDKKYQMKELEDKLQFIGYGDKDNKILMILDVMFPRRMDSLVNIKQMFIDKTWENGCIVEVRNEKFGYSRLSASKRYMREMQVYRYALKKDVLERRSITLTNLKDLEKYHSYRSSFTVGVPLGDKDGVSVFSNGMDISWLYNQIANSTKMVNNIYNLYMDIVTKDNMEDRNAMLKDKIRAKGVGYYYHAGIRKQEEDVCGKADVMWHFTQDVEILRDYVFNIFRRRGYISEKSREYLNSLGLIDEEGQLKKRKRIN